MGGAVRKAAEVVSAPFVAPVQAVASVATGGNVGDAAKKVVGSVAVASTGAAGQLTQVAASNDKIRNTVSKVPFVGGAVVKSGDSASRLQAGDVSALKDFGLSQGVLAGTVAGGYYGYQALGSTGVFAGALTANSLSRGDFTGALQGGLGLGSSFVPDGYGDLYGSIKDSLFGGKSTPAGPQIGVDNPNSQLSAGASAGEGSGMVWLYSGLAVAGVYLLTRKKKHG